MAKTITFSFSVPVDLAILIEEKLETDKITRSELIKRALWNFLDKQNDNKIINRLNEIQQDLLEVKNILQNK
ncbi:hypothetical protein [Rickettsia australis]|uniref:Ribbon-helix-helix protein CopG domain-containing protein n=1 Tax=Rickettsia australis (strain Cutlack) TaxID=1105110 RepID=H8K9Y9_RICAC|nr:hypothetical protein [Rickettsia australis]AFC71699.1 hypothetical protein MC5_07425 [Rickettsia australis str. Cutlack]